MRGASDAVKYLTDVIGIDSPPKRVSVILFEILILKGWPDNDDTGDIVNLWEKGFVSAIHRRIAYSLSNSTPLTYEFNDVNVDYIQGSCYISRKATKQEATEKRLRANAHRYVDEFKSLSDANFELLSARILTLWKVEEEIVSRSSADQGIDFYGRIPFGQLLKPSAIGHGAEQQLKIWLVGQSKNYRASQVSTKDIRELVGSVNLAKSKIYAGSTDPLAKLQMRTCDPVFFLFFTTGKISRDAWDLLKKAGVVAMDGNQLAFFLADHGAGLEDGRFESEAFRRWAFDTEHV